MATHLPEQLQPLTAQQQQFVSNHVATSFASAKQAAIDANYSPKNAAQQASRLLSKANIQAAIEAKRAAIAVQVDYSISDWTRDLHDDIAQAKAAGSHGAVMKGRELLGKSIGALQGERRLSDDEEKMFAYQRAEMLEYFKKKEAERAGAIEVESRVVGEETSQRAGGGGGTG